MEEVLEKFESALGQDNGDEAKTNYEGLYKNWGKLGNQEERRKQILEIQKSNRNNSLDTCRGILQLMNAVEQTEIFKSQNRVYYRPNIYVAGFSKAHASYNNVLMLSEWMIEKPHDFSENWFVVPCPTGVRMLVVANGGITKCYTKFGHFRFEFFSLLPGGHRPKKTNQCCVLDCFYSEKINTMFILDILAWNCQPMTDGETEFRQYWLNSQLEEIIGLDAISKRNEVIFKMLPKVPCAPESFAEFMKKYPHFDHNFPTMDGLLFYHKHAHYVSGQTPLVGWLYPYMVPEVLGQDIEINEIYKVQKPADYVDQKEFIEKFEAKQAKKKQPQGRRSRLNSSNSSSMDTAEVKTEGQAVSNQTKPKTEKCKPTVNEGKESDAVALPMEQADVNQETKESEETKEAGEVNGVGEINGAGETKEPEESMDLENTSTQKEEATSA